MSSVVNNGVSVAVDQNEYLADGADIVDAVISVETGADLVAAEPPARRVEILILDCSGSMAAAGRFDGARNATMAALRVLPEGALFAIVAGTSMANLLYPTDAPSVPANDDTRAAAWRHLDALRPSGGTAIGTWLGLTRQLAVQHEGAMVHAILLTDGKNEHEDPATLAEEIARSQGVFTCDCRGVGTDWRVQELREIASALHGTVDIVKEPAQLAEDFTAMTRSSLAKAIPELTLRVWTPAGATVRFVKQVAPAIEDLTARRVEAGGQIGEYPLGSWGAEERDYHLQVRLEPAAPGREKLAARITVSAGGEVVGQGLVRAVWTTQTDLSARISRRVAHYTGQAELAEAVREGLAARNGGDVETATAKLRRAVELAEESGNEHTAALLRGVVEVDEYDGTVRLRATVAAADEMALDARSTKTKRVGR